ELGRAGDATCRPFVHTLAGGESVEDFFLVLSLGTAEEVAQGNEDCAHDAGDGWGQRGEVRRGRFGRAEEGRSIFGGVGGAVFRALGEFVCGRATGVGDQRAHLVEAGVQHLLRVGDTTATRDPPACRKGCAPHYARGPDVAVDATFVAEAVGEAGLAEQFVELG